MPNGKRAYTPKLKGCHECSQRRINCDRTEPSCIKCISKGLQCSGFGIRYRFNDDVISSPARCKRRRMQTPIGNTIDNELAEQIGGELPATAIFQKSVYETSAMTQNINTHHWPIYFDDQPSDQGVANAISERRATEMVEDGVQLSVEFECPFRNVSEEASIYPNPSDNLAGWKSYYLRHFDRRIAPEMVVIDDNCNGWRTLILPVAHLDSLVMEAVLAAAAFHLSNTVTNFPHSPSQLYAKSIQQLRTRQDLSSQDLNSRQSVLLALLVLLATVMVNGFTDFPTIFNLIETAIKAVGGEEKIMHGELGLFVVRQIRKYRGYAAPYLSQDKGLTRLIQSTTAAHGTCEGWDCFNYYYEIHPELSQTLSTMYRLFQLSSDIYTARAKAGPLGPPLTQMVSKFARLFVTIRPGTRGEHILVFALFIAAAESVLPEHREMFSDALSNHHKRNGFANIQLALDRLREIWKGAGVCDWTQLLPSWRVFIV